MLPPLLFLLPASALAATLALPAGEAAASWVGPARLAGLTLAGPAEPADVVCMASPQGWMIRVEGVDGTVRRERVPVPSDARGREDLAWLASSLLEDVAARAGEVRPVLPASASDEEAAASVPSAPVPTVRQPRQARKPPPPQVVAPAPPPQVEAVAKPVLVIPAAPVRTPDPPPTPAALPGAPVAPRALRPWAATAFAYTHRTGLSPGAQLSVEGGLVAREDWLLGLRVTLPSDRDVAGTDGSLRALDLLGCAAWSPDHRLAPQLGASAGLSYGTWRQAGDMLHARLIPVAEGEAGLSLRLSPALHLIASADLGVELAHTEVQAGSADPFSLTPWQEEARLALRGQIP